jgi:hypothetical protein
MLRKMVNSESKKTRSPGKLEVIDLRLEACWWMSKIDDFRYKTASEPE